MIFYVGRCALLTYETSGGLRKSTLEHLGGHRSLRKTGYWIRCRFFEGINLRTGSRFPMASMMDLYTLSWTTWCTDNKASVAANVLAVVSVDCKVKLDYPCMPRNTKANHAQQKPFKKKCYIAT